MSFIYIHMHFLYKIDKERKKKRETDVLKVVFFIIIIYLKQTNKQTKKRLENLKRPIIFIHLSLKLSIHQIILIIK